MQAAVRPRIRKRKGLSQLEFVALVIAAVGPAMAVSHVVGIPASIALFGLGVATAFIPGLPPMRLDPQLVLGLFLPPVLYAATVRVSFHLLRFTLVSGVLLGTVLTFATIGAVAAAARLLMPGLSWIGALLIAIVVAVFDTRLFHEAKGRPHVPRVIADALKTREMVSRIVVLSCFSLALGTLLEGPPGPAALLGGFAYDIAGGVLAGAAIGQAVVWLRERTDPAPVEIAVSVATPYLGALAAQKLGLSVAVVIITSALVVSAVRIDRRTGAPKSSSEARITAMAFWEQASLMLSAVLFFLAGRSLPEAMAALGHRPFGQVALAAAALLALVLAVQYAAGLATAALTGVPRTEGHLPGATKAAAVMSWASTRSVVGLVIALSVPATLPDGRSFAERDLVLVVTALMIVGSIVLQGLTLRRAVRSAGLGDREEDQREENLAERAMVEARPEAASEDSPVVNDFDAERRALLRLRETDRIGDEVLRRMLRETDLRSRAAEKSSLPGAGPPNP
jgi:NhaP-type Na+/H+ or K+/H+ antiporter